MIEPWYADDTVTIHHDDCIDRACAPWAPPPTHRTASTQAHIQDDLFGGVA